MHTLLIVDLVVVLVGWGSVVAEENKMFREAVGWGGGKRLEEGKLKEKW